MKVKYIKSNGNDCVVRALKAMTGKTPNLKVDNRGVKTADWISWGLDNGLNYNRVKPTNVTMKQLGDFSKKYKSGIIAKLQNPNKKGDGHTVYIKNGVVHDDVKTVDDNLKVRLVGFASKE